MSEISSLTQTQLSSKLIGGKFILWTLVATGALCLTALYFAWQDRSWGALWIAFIGSPSAFGLLMVAEVAVALIIHRRRPDIKYSDMLPYAFGMPLVGAGITIVAIFMMGLHGC